MFKHNFLFPAFLCWLIVLSNSIAGDLSEAPLSLKATVPPNVLFALSVEYPTANTAAYQDASSYVNTTDFLGMFDKNKCYSYDSDHGWFVPASVTSNHKCTDSNKWSGNFLNWATMAGLDEFRHAMTGGTRYCTATDGVHCDEPSFTILERTYQDGQGGTGNFTDKTFDLSNANFVGAIPSSTGFFAGTIVNQGMGVRMQLQSTKQVTMINCTGWSSSSPYNCTSFSIDFNPNSATITCGTSTTSWTNNSTKKVCQDFKSNKSNESITVFSGVDGCQEYGNSPYPTSSPSVTHCKKYKVYYTVSPSYAWPSYNVRAQACVEGLLESNCKLYGTNYWKPIGVIQQNGEKMRYGIFSYFKDDNINNAVMRSKLKYVAPNQYASSIGSVVNNNAEWSDTDGTLIKNPDPTVAAASYCKEGSGCAVSNSGVINYINKFGNPLGYKRYDNVGKLYYEALTYLRNRTPDTLLYYAATKTNNDSFPVIKGSDWDDPIQYSCQKNYIIVMGDSHTHCDKNLPGSSLSSSGPSQCAGSTSDANNPPDKNTTNNLGNNGDTGDSAVANDKFVTTWTNKLGTMEGHSTLATETTGAGNAGSYYMAGLAYWAKLNDIRPLTSKAQTVGTQTVKTFVVDVQENKDKGNTQSPTSLPWYSQYWLATKYGGADSFVAKTDPVVANRDKPLSWADSTGTWPKTLLAAGDPTKMELAVKTAFESILAGIYGVESALAQSSGDLRTAGGSYIYQAIFNSGGWYGDVMGFLINTRGTVVDTNGDATSDPVWKTSTWLGSHTYANRNIFSFNDGLKAGASNTVIADTGNINSRKGIRLPQSLLTDAQFTSLFSSRQRDQLNLNDLETPTSDGFGKDRVNYIIGDTGNEGTLGKKWRVRTSKLGDFVNSSPAYVGDPLPGLVGPGYGTFRQDHANRKPMLYAGSNDGFLHGFDASSPGTSGATPGQELLAYMPSAVYPKLRYLMSSSYSHKYYVDGNPVVSEVCFGDCPAANPVWKTMLVGGLNAGGRGIYALDVTDPALFATTTGPNLVLWEFTNQDDADLGYTFGEPIIKKMNNGKWAVILGNGYNNTNSLTDTPGSTTGRAYLYIVFVDGPSGTGKPWWKLGMDYVKIELKTTGETSPLPNNPPNGLSAPVAVDKTLNGTIDLIYAGDRKGNIWKIDVSSQTPSSWGTVLGTTSYPTPLFTAKDSSGNAQQITSSLEISRHPLGGFLAFFGTGSYIDNTDPQPENSTTQVFNTQTFYGVWDKDNYLYPNTGFTTITRSNLQSQRVLSTQKHTDTVCITDADNGTTCQNEDNTFYIQSNCIPNYGTGNASTYPYKTDSSGYKTADSTNCPDGMSSTGQQLGWKFDLPGSGERMIADRPMVQGGILTFTSLTPASDPCTGNTVGKMYDLDYASGGRVTRGGGVYDTNGDKVIDSYDKIAVTTLGSSSTDTATWIAPSGKLLISGASETPLRLRLPDGSGPSGVGAGGGGSVSPSNVTITGGCNDFVAGWGCMSSLGRKPLGANYLDFVSNQKLGENNNMNVGSTMDSTSKSIPTKSGRVSWREIMR